ncbi:guanylyl cyclase-activating protein 1-like [Liolophura sinensis]|uniref:guanylyl cyclase-activating protein 1-like n=1 Tax=Liolophura sinensis TaxID=3198878 RepID=UPI003158A898
MSNLGEYIEKKYRVFFRYLDRNHDGVLHRSDLMKRVDTMSHMNVANQSESIYTRQCWLRWCDKVFPPKDGKKGVTEDDFVEKFRHFRSTGEIDEVNAASEGIYNVLFDRLDANRDGHLSRDELKAFYQALGKADDTFIDRLFRKLDVNHDGLVSKSELVEAGVAFWTSEDVNSGYEIMYEIN